MGIKESILACLEVIPIIRRGLRWLLERNMEVTVEAYFKDMKPYNISAPDSVTGIRGGVYSLLNLKLINHRTDRPERIIGCWAELRKRKLLFWRRTLTTIPVLTHPPNIGYPLDLPIKDIYLEPMGKLQTYVINIIGDLEDFEMPRRSELVLVFRMVGPMRKYTHKLTNVWHNPKPPQIPTTISLSKEQQMEEISDPEHLAKVRGTLDALIERGEELTHRMLKDDFHKGQLGQEVRQWLDKTEHDVWEVIPEYGGNLTSNQISDKERYTDQEVLRYAGWDRRAAAIRVSVDRRLTCLREIRSHIQSVDR